MWSISGREEEEEEAKETLRGEKMLRTLSADH